MCLGGVGLGEPLSMGEQVAQPHSLVSERQLCTYIAYRTEHGNSEKG